jgi:transcriptional regulator with PAS, ATPase and Fis domain
MIGRDPIMRRVFDMVRVVARTDATVLIEGATGTGKDLLAKVIHSASPRAGRVMVKVNCAALPDTLLESEMFGYARGAFTGADRDKPGRFQEADGGTIFLDEICDLPLSLQAKLLRVIEDREFYPLGSRRTLKVHVRVISASNRGLEELVAKGLFREDLFYRLNVLRIELPPLRQRRGDLPLLIRHITRRLSSAMGKSIPALSEKALKILLNYDYPGNVRELENILEHALIICPSEVIQTDHLPDYLGRKPRSRKYTRPDSHGSEDRREHERGQILDALHQNNGNRTATARALGIDRSTLWRKMKKFDLLS